MLYVLFWFRLELLLDFHGMASRQHVASMHKLRANSTLVVLEQHLRMLSTVTYSLFHNIFGRIEVFSSFFNELSSYYLSFSSFAWHMLHCLSSLSDAHTVMARLSSSFLYIQRAVMLFSSICLFTLPLSRRLGN